MNYVSFVNIDQPHRTMQEHRSNETTKNVSVFYDEELY